MIMFLGDSPHKYTSTVVYTFAIVMSLSWYTPNIIMQQN